MQYDFNIVNLADADNISPYPEYVFTFDAPLWDALNARIALKHFPAKVINVSMGDTEQIFNTFMNHLTELKEVYESLLDEESRRTFYGYWLGRISNQFDKFVFSNNDHYLIEGFIPASGAIVIDGGVFDGGTATVFSEMGYRVYGFEMDKKNFEYAKKIGDEKGFVVENLSLGAFKHEMQYKISGSSRSKWSPKGEATTQVVTLDAYVRENKLPRVDFIKLDVEGAELDILKGARTVIARFKPILAISAYHKLDDFWVLMNYIKSIRSDYEFALRHGTETPEGTPLNFSDDRKELLHSFGLEIEQRGWAECVLFAR